MKTIRRNSVKKITAIAKSALHGYTSDHSGPEGPKVIEDVDLLLERFFEWTNVSNAGRVYTQSGQRYEVIDGVRMLCVQETLVLSWHSNYYATFILSSEVA